MQLKVGTLSDSLDKKSIRKFVALKNVYRFNLRLITCTRSSCDLFHTLSSDDKYKSQSLGQKAKGGKYALVVL